MKEQMRKSHADLVEQGFMTKLKDMSEKTRKFIESAPFPWRTVAKEDSIHGSGSHHDWIESYPSKGRE